MSRKSEVKNEAAIDDNKSENQTFQIRPTQNQKYLNQIKYYFGTFFYCENISPNIHY